ncbi:hypothetical protein E3T61_11470 [Cryobacterium lactosi]|uniref:Lipoprotein LpqB N-terminal domain-containing protein n=1 Tax=Cryobacterium lactosi TaxID=1259202 RepID=A0A4R9BQJ0_9MICO|nr:hypothetical protein E3T61_11470 [Cryobacterium lactosi]
MPQAPPARRDPALLVVVGLIALLVAVALIVVFTRGEPAQLDPDTPGGVVQRYSAAVLDGDETVAAGYLSAAALTGCDRTTAVDPSATDDIRITLVETTERDASADVQVLIVTTYGSGPFGSSEYESEEAFDLVKVDGDWLVNEAPWQLAVCPPSGDTL